MRRLQTQEVVNMRRLRSILVDVGPKVRGELAVARAARLASEHRARVTLVVHSERSSTSPVALDHLAQLLVERGVELRFRVLRGNRLTTLLDEVERVDADIVIKAADLADISPSAFRSSFSERLIRSCPVPVWVVRIAPAAYPARVIAVLQGRRSQDAAAQGKDDHDARVLSIARRLVERTHATLSVLTHDILVDESGEATRLPSDSQRPVDLAVTAIEELRADAVVVASANGGKLTGPDNLAAGVLRHSSASLIVVPSSSAASRFHRKSSRSARAMLSFPAAWLMAGCASAASVGSSAPSVVVAPAAVAKVAPAGMAYTERFVCDDGENNVWLPDGAYARETSCCPRSTVSPWTASAFGSSDAVRLTIGAATSQCGPPTIQTETLREPSLSPSDTVRPQPGMVELSW